MRRQLSILFTVMGAALLLSAGVALAATIACDGGTCSGTNRGDTMRGTAGFDKMYGRDGNDRMRGNRSADVMYGGEGADTISGHYGGDRIYGGSGNDILRGAIGGDRIFGGTGRDTVYGGPGSEYIYIAGDGQHDSVDCGLGRDTVVFDRADANQDNFDDFIRLASCENGRLREGS